MIAMALANEPDLLIADEPTTALDVTVQAQILKLLKELQTEHGMAILFITHDLGIVRKIADRVVMLLHGRVAAAGTFAELERSTDPMVQAFLAGRYRRDDSDAPPPRGPLGGAPLPDSIVV
jgi:microcin C transport system ATP-binding protein